MLKVSGKGGYKNKSYKKERRINVHSILHWLNGGKSLNPL